MSDQSRVAVRVVLLDPESRVLLFEGRDLSEFDFINHGEPQHQVEHFFAARTRDTSLSDQGWTELEKAAMTTWRWWTTDELEAEGGVQYFPDNLVDLVRLADALV
jgi:hypothetical protein